MDRKQVLEEIEKLQTSARQLTQHLADLSEPERDALAAVLPDLAPLFHPFRTPSMGTGALGEHSHQVYIESELSRLLEENRRQQSLLNAIFAADPSGLAVVAGPELRFVYANPAYRYICPLLGQDPTGQPYEQIWPAEEGDRFHAQIQAVLETGRPYQVQEAERKYPDGSRRVFTFQTRRIEWGTEPAALMIFWDTTDLIHSQRRLEQLLEETHHLAEEMQGLFNAMRDAVIIYDTEGVVLHANPALIHILGFDPTGRKREEFAREMMNRWPDGREIPIDQLPSLRALRGETVDREQIQVTNADGQSFIVQVSASLLYTTDQQLAGVVVVWHDITDQERAEQALRENSQALHERAAMLEAVMDVVPAMIWIAHDRDCREMTGNRYGSEFLRMWQGANISKTAPEAELTLQPYRNFKNGREIPAHELPMQVAATTGVPARDYEFDLVFSDNVTRTVLGNVEPLRDSDGNPCGAVAAFIDITERMEAEQRAAVQQEWFQTTLSSIGDAVIATDAEGRIRFLNPVAEQLTGWTTVETAGKPIEMVFNIINEQTRQPAVNPVGKVLEQGVIVGLANHTALISREGHEIPIEDSAAPIKDSKGRTLGVVMVFHDVTEKRKAEQALRASEAKYRTVADFTFDWEYWIAPDGTFRYVSPSCERISGYASSAFLKDPGLLLEITHPEDWDRVLSHFQNERQNNLGAETLDFRILTPGGEVRWINHVCQPVVDQHGQWAGRRASNRDITEREQYEAERERLLAENSRQRAFLEAQSSVDPGGQAVVSGEDFIIRYTNPAYRGLTPHPETDPLGQPYVKIWPPEEGFSQIAILRQAMSDRQEVHLLRHERRMPDGSVHYFTFHLHPMAWEGQPAVYLVLWDTTELVQTEEALRRSEAVLRQQHQLIEQSYEPIFIWALDGGIVTWNQGCEQLYGFGRDEVIGKSVHTLLQTRHPVALEDIKEQLQIQGQWTGELRQKARDGRELIIECRKQLIEAEGRQLVLETSRDVTAQRLFEQRLAAEREWLRTTLASIGDAVITTDITGQVTFLNPIAEQLTGWTSAEAAGKAMDQVFRIINEQTHQPAVNPVGKVLEHGGIVGLANHTALLTRDGRQIPIEDSAAPIKDEVGRTLGVVMVFRDVTEKRRMEQALHESRTLLQTVMQEAQDPIFLKDRDSRILLANPATLKVIGKPADQVIGKNDAEFYEDPEVGRMIMENDRRIMERSQTEVVEERVIYPGEPPESARIFLSTKTPYRDAEGQVIGIVGVARDITDRKQKEKELNQLNRTLRALNKSHQAMMRAGEERSFMQDVCRIITEDCGYAMVWIGLAEHDEAKSVRPVAFAGFEEGYLDSLHVTWADIERGRGPTGTAIRTGRPSMCRNMLTDPRFTPWREEALKRGYASSLVLPMLSMGNAFGAITIYAREPDAFSENEINLLGELASDLAYGITAMRVRAAHAEVEQALRESEARYRNLFQGMTEGFALHEIVCDENDIPKDYRFLEINPAFEQLTGLRAEDLKGRLYSQIDQLRADGSRWVEIYGKVALTGEPIHFEDYSPALKRHYEVVAYRPAPRQFAVIFMDVTERKQAEEALRLARDAVEKNLTQIEVQRRLIEQREQERQRIARDLHDGPVQMVTGITYNLQSLAMGSQDPQLVLELDEMRQSLQEVINELRAYAQELRPPVLFSFGLRRAIQAHLESFQEKHPEIHPQLEVDWDGDLLPEQTSIALFRVYQECLNNILKHAQANHIWVFLSRHQNQVSLVIEDNGAGFVLPENFLSLAREGHLGLVGMRERVDAIGGTMEIDSQPGKGTRIQVHVQIC